MIRVLLLIFLLSSCSVGTLVIGNLDYFIARKVNSYLDLYYRQSQQLEKDIKSWLNDLKPHAKTLLEKAKEYKEQINSEKVEKEYIEKQGKELMGIWFKVSDKMSSLFAKYFAILDESQQQHFLEIWKKKTVDLADRAKKKKIKHTYERYENYFGKLTGKQREVFKEKKQFIFARSERKLASRMSFTRELEELFAKKTDEEGHKLLIDKYMSNIFRKDETKVYLDITFSLLNELSKEQREKFRTKMGLFIKYLDVFIVTKY